MRQVLHLVSLLDWTSDLEKLMVKDGVSTEHHIASFMWEHASRNIHNYSPSLPHDFNTYNQEGIRYQIVSPMDTDDNDNHNSDDITAVQPLPRKRSRGKSKKPPKMRCYFTRSKAGSAGVDGGYYLRRRL